MKKSFLSLTTSTLILLMVFTIHPQIAFADEGTPTGDENGTITVEGTPPPEENTEEIETSSAQSEAVDPVSEAATSPAEEETTEVTEVVSPSKETETTSEIEQSESTPDQPEAPEEKGTPSVTEVLEQAPDGTQLVILDNEGRPEPLASQEAAAIMVNGDPMWCPGNTAPGGAGCTSSYSTFEDLLTNLGSYSGDGTIYVANTYDLGNVEPFEITIDGNSFANLGALTIQGGWDFSTANIVGTSTFKKSLEIINWGSKVTIKDVVFSNTNFGLTIETTGAASLSNVAVNNTANSDGITVQAGGDVTFSDVSSTSNNGIGAVIDSGGDVSIEDSSFDNNGQGNVYGDGLEVNAIGNITISNLTAIGNLEGGALLDSNNNITITKAVFNNNIGAISGYGLETTANGNVSLSDVVASSNYEFGASITSQGLVDIRNSTFSGNLTYEGLVVDANSKITLDTVVASNNAAYGAVLENNDDVLVTNSIFSGNAGPGYSEGLEITSPGTVQLSSVNASNNGNDGIAIYDSTNVLLQNVTALSNAWDGALVEANCTKVEALGSNFSGNGFYGIEVATGQLTISGSQFMNNTYGFISVEDGDCFFIPPRKLVLSYSFTETTLPWNIVSVDDNGSSINLDCNYYIGTILVLENGDRLKLPCPLVDKASLSRISIQDLPVNLPEGYQYISGMKSTITRAGIPLEILDTAVTISFKTDDANNNLAIFYWDGLKWQDLTAFGYQSGIIYSSDQFLFWNGNDWTSVLPDDEMIVGQAGSMTSDGYFEAVLNFTGIFILAEKPN